LKIHLPSHIFSLSILLLVLNRNPQFPFVFLQTLFNQATLLVRTPQTFEFQAHASSIFKQGIRVAKKDVLYN
jgi:hypothetical protein